MSDYIAKGSNRPNGYFAEVRRKSDNKLIFEQECVSLEMATSVANAKLERLKSEESE